MNHKKWMLLLFTLGILVAGCGRQEAIPPTQDFAPLYTAAVETAQALYTELPSAEITTAPTFTPIPTAGLTTNTPGAATITPGEAPANTCDVAGFVADITIPDGTQLAPGEAFTKTWELSNDGTCTWNAGYEIVYSNGPQMGAPSVQAITTEAVAPGDTLKISLKMVAPTEDGKYVGYWILRNDKGQYFGIGTTLGAIYVDIIVVTATESVTATSTTAGDTPTFTPAATGTPTETPIPSETLTPIPE